MNQNTVDRDKVIINYYSTTRPYISGLDIRASEVYSICPGKVISVGCSDQQRYVVTVLVNDNQMIRYANIESVSVKEGQQVSFYDAIGDAHTFVRLEYCTLDKGDSMWPVRVKSITMYKQDPMRLVLGQDKLNVPVNNVIYSTGNEPSVLLTNHTDAEFTGSRGDSL